MAEVKSKNKYAARFLNPASIWAILWTLFQLFIVIKGTFDVLILRPIHVGFAMGLALLTKPMFKKNAVPKGQKYRCKWYDYILCAMVVFCVVYMLVEYPRLTRRIAMVDPLTTMDYIVGCTFILILLECSRRAVNVALTVIVALFLAYGAWGFVLPGLLGHIGQNLTQILETQIYSTSGVFTSPTGVSQSMVFYFLLFGAFLTATPAAKLFINLSNLFSRKSVGGAGKATVFASAFFGMISGSAPANVSSIGTLLYPSMKEQGFDSKFSGSLLAIGGTAGQIIPPVMGAAAFIMVDMAGTKYSEVMKGAIVPSFLYLLSLYLLVHFYAKKNKLQAPNFNVDEIKKEVKSHLHLLIAVVILVILIIKGVTMMRATVYSSIALVLICMLKKDTRINFFKVVEVLESTAKQAIGVALPCALAGIIVGEIVSTGLGLRFSSMINAMAQNSLFLALFVTMLMALVLGMGMPTSAAYIMSASLLAPTIISLGVPAIVAHFFIFYFANLSMITPPVALSSYAAAGIVGDDMWKVGGRAFIYSLIIFIIPYAFVYSPAMLCVGELSEMIQPILTAILSTIAICMGYIGYGITKLSAIERIAIIVAALLLIVPETITDIIGLAILAVCIALQFTRNKKQIPA